MRSNPVAPTDRFRLQPHSIVSQQMRRGHLKLFSSLAAALVAMGCNGEGQSFTLYRNSVSDPSMRIHVASFDSSDGPEYNRGNCEQAQQLFQNQSGVKTKFWCEKGRYRK